jgi:transposase
MNATTFGLDIAKNVMQLHWVEPATGEIKRKKLSRGKLCEFFAQREPARIALEACGGAHHWARTLGALGHRVELLPARQVRPFACGNKDDAADARAIWLAAQHGDIRRVAGKSVQQQAIQATHRMRSHWVSVRTASINALRGLLCEFGVVLPQGKQAGLKALSRERESVDAQIPPLMASLVDQQLEMLRDIEQHIDALEKKLAAVQRELPSAARLRAVPGIGLLGATALAATLGDGSGWRNGREFACCLGLVPRHDGTGGKVNIGAMSKRGDPYLRTLLISGARAVLRQSTPTPWVAQMLGRRPVNVVAVALAHKLARTAWALVAHERSYEARWCSAPPQRSGASMQIA